MRYCLSLLVVLLLAACGSPPEEPADRPLPVTASRIADLIPPDSALSAVPWGVTADPSSGQVYVADWTGTRVAVFDSTGSWVGDFGREGDGPGEFRSPSAAALDPQGALVVWDTGRQILSRWSPEGRLLDERRPELDYWGPGFAVGEQGIATVTVERDPDGAAVHQRLVARSGGDTRILHELTREQVPMELPCISMPAPRVYAPSIIWTGRGDTVYVHDGPAYEIDVFVDDSLARTVRRDLDPIPVTRAMAIDRVETGPYASFMQTCGVDAAAIVDAVGHEETIAPVLGLAVDPSERLWVTRTTDGAHAEAVDVFRPDGSYEGTLTSADMPVAFLSDSLLVSVRLVATGQQVAALYRLEGDERAAPAE